MVRDDAPLDKVNLLGCGAWIQPHVSLHTLVLTPLYVWVNCMCLAGNVFCMYVLQRDNVEWMKLHVHERRPALCVILFLNSIYAEVLPCPSFCRRCDPTVCCALLHVSAVFMLLACIDYSSL